MNRNILYLVIGALVVVAAVVGYLLYQDRLDSDAARAALIGSADAR